MNRDSEKSDSESENNSAKEAVKNTNNKSVKVEGIGENKVKKENLIDSAKVIEFTKSRNNSFFRTISHSEVIDKLLASGKIEEKVKTGRSGSRSDPGVVHIELEQIKRKAIKRTTKMDLDKAVSIIPTCTGKKDVSEFINACEIALNDIKEVDKPLLIKIITSKLSGNALEVTRYRNLDSWAAIKSILQGAFEQKVSERALAIGLNTARMTEGESVSKFANRIEELYYKLCATSTANLDKDEALVVKNQTKKQAMLIFMTGLPHHLYLVLKARDPKTLEEAIQMAQDEEIEYESKMKIEGLQNNVERQNFNGNTPQSANGNNIKNQNNGNNNLNRNQQNNRGGNNNLGRYNNNYNNRNNNGYNRFNGNNNSGGYNNSGRKQNFNTYQQNNNNSRNGSNTGCYTCGKPNHIARDCWHSQNQSRGSGQPMINRGNNNGARNFGNNNNARRENSTNQSLHCSYCNKVGHEITNCYTKQRNEKNNTNNVSKNVQRANPSGVRFVSEIAPQDEQETFFTSQQN